MKKKLFFVLGIILLLVILVFTFNGIVVLSSKNRIINIDEVNNIDNVDAILVLGCKVNPDGTPSMMLRNRAEKGIELYKKTGIKILLSGDHDTKGYDEVNTMKDMVKDSIPKEDIFLDHAGLSTYDSIYRAKNIYGINKMIIVTQKYHLYRAVYISKKLNLEAYGVAANPRKYAGRVFREIREVIARNKDFLKTIIKPSSKYLGEKINLNDDGNITND